MNNQLKSTQHKTKITRNEAISKFQEVIDYKDFYCFEKKVTL